MTEGRPELQDVISKGNDWTRILRKAVAHDTRTADGCIEVMPNILTVVAETMESLLAALRAHPDLRAWVQHKEDCRLFEGWIDTGDNDPFFQHKRGKNCTCGLDAALRSLEEGRQAQTEASAAPQEEKWAV